LAASATDRTHDRLISPGGHSSNTRSDADPPTPFQGGNRHDWNSSYQGSPVRPRPRGGAAPCVDSRLLGGACQAAARHGRTQGARDRFTSSRRGKASKTARRETRRAARNAARTRGTPSRTHGERPRISSGVEGRRARRVFHRWRTSFLDCDHHGSLVAGRRRLGLLGRVTARLIGAELGISHGCRTIRTGSVGPPSSTRFG